MKKLFCSIIAASAFAGSISADNAARDAMPKKDQKVADMMTASPSSLKVVFIDLLQAVRESDEGKEEAKRLMAQQEERIKEVQTKNQELEQGMKDFQTKAATMSDTARAKREEELMKMKRNLENRAKESEEEFNMIAQRAMERVARSVEAAVKRVAQELRLDAVIDISGRVVYSAEKVNYTAAAIKEMNKDYSVKLASNATSATSADKNIKA